MKITRGRRFSMWSTMTVVTCAVFGMIVLSSVAALAQQDPYVETTPTVLPTLIEQPVDNGDEIDDETLGTVIERPSLLPFTGGDLTLFVATGAALIATGMGIARLRRRGSS